MTLLNPVPEGATSPHGSKRSCHDGIVLGRHDNFGLVGISPMLYSVSTVVFDEMDCVPTCTLCNFERECRTWNLRIQQIPKIPHCDR